MSSEQFEFIEIYYQFGGAKMVNHIFVQN